ncbi:hypothetical protein [Niveispirillum lacus]|nr:hypothetical protein [Niveispirillum lacus]
MMSTGEQQSFIRPLGAAIAARLADLPAQFDAPVPARESLLEGFRRRNALLDGIFYDVKVITPAEARAIAPRWGAEGKILIVPPSDAGPLRLVDGPANINKAERRSLKALAIAGVGSSALGTAAFARNVADAIGGPVVAVISGYGLSDLVTEALGGYFFFGMLNGLRHRFEALDRLTAPGSASVDGLGDLLLRSSRDTQTVLSLLTEPGFDFRLLTGHSKGNLVLAEALYALEKQAPETAQSLADKAALVTVSARIGMPGRFGTVIDIMGEWDWFGALNSRPTILPDHVVPWAWHHTNTDLYASLPVTPALRAVLDRWEIRI